MDLVAMVFVGTRRHLLSCAEVMLSSGGPLVDIGQWLRRLRLDILVRCKDGSFDKCDAFLSSKLHPAFGSKRSHAEAFLPSDLEFDVPEGPS